MNTQELKTFASGCGADLVGVASADRWAHWPVQHQPRSILPKCESVIVLGRRILRGAFRGIEEGTNFGSTYGHYGRQWHEEAFLSRTIHQVACALESAGHEAIPLFGGGTPGERKAVGPSGITANVTLDCKALAHEAGLGEVGRGGFFLTAAYGHRQRFGLVLTDLALEGDPVVTHDFCRDCEACRTACPLGALGPAADGEPFPLETALCERCANGASSGGPNAYERLDRLAASCGRACLVALEQRVEQRFQAPFRRRSVWTRDLEGIPAVRPLAGKGTPA